ncbi:hypothetical protein LX83_005089 [Goodfellowiella coeruleoviolacea]|uniref:Uncharacterized protein n=1 Tax=Goodfellowiella coeruleoviolacea TaxID=334858 RepID=A0AAE3GH85_9PSEU|nr:hypothetical protein [Goodfellowiella coeruleoviolacea]
MWWEAVRFLGLIEFLTFLLFLWREKWYVRLSASLGLVLVWLGSFSDVSI